MSATSPPRATSAPPPSPAYQIDNFYFTFFIKYIKFFCPSPGLTGWFFLLPTGWAGSDQFCQFCESWSRWSVHWHEKMGTWRNYIAISFLLFCFCLRNLLSFIIFQKKKSTSNWISLKYSPNQWHTVVISTCPVITFVRPLGWIKIQKTLKRKEKPRLSILPAGAGYSGLVGIVAKLNLVWTFYRNQRVEARVNLQQDAESKWYDLTAHTRKVWKQKDWDANELGKDWGAATADLTAGGAVVQHNS